MRVKSGKQNAWKQVTRAEDCTGAEKVDDVVRRNGVFADDSDIVKAFEADSDANAAVSLGYYGERTGSRGSGVLYEACSMEEVHDRFTPGSQRGKHPIWPGDAGLSVGRDVHLKENSLAMA